MGMSTCQSNRLAGAVAFLLCVGLVDGERVGVVGSAAAAAVAPDWQLVGEHRAVPLNADHHHIQQALHCGRHVVASHRRSLEIRHAIQTLVYSTVYENGNSVHSNSSTCARGY